MVMVPLVSGNVEAVEGTRPLNSQYGPSERKTFGVEGGPHRKLKGGSRNLSISEEGYRERDDYYSRQNSSQQSEISSRTRGSWKVDERAPQTTVQIGFSHSLSGERDVYRDVDFDIDVSETSFSHVRATSSNESRGNDT